MDKIIILKIVVLNYTGSPVLHSKHTESVATLSLLTEQTSVCLSHLICSKSKAALLKTVILPKLELYAAVLLAKLIKRVQAVLQFDWYRVTL